MNDRQVKRIKLEYQDTREPKQKILSDMSLPELMKYVLSQCDDEVLIAYIKSKFLSSGYDENDFKTIKSMKY